MAKISPQQAYVAQRRVARKLSLMAMYQWQLNEESFADIYTYYQVDESMAGDLRKADGEYFKALTETAMRDADGLDQQLVPFLDRPLDQIGPIEHAVLMLGLVELRDYPDVSFKTAVNEWVNLCKKFGPEQSFKFVNGVLDKVGTELRPHEKTAP